MLSSLFSFLVVWSIFFHLFSPRRTVWLSNFPTQAEAQLICSRVWTFNTVTMTWHDSPGRDTNISPRQSLPHIHTPSWLEYWNVYLPVFRCVHKWLLRLRSVDCQAFLLSRLTRIQTRAVFHQRIDWYLSLSGRCARLFITFLNFHVQYLYLIYISGIFVAHFKAQSRENRFGESGFPKL